MNRTMAFYFVKEAPFLHNELINNWTLPHRQADLDKYYLLYWNPVYFDAVWNEGIITREGIDYQVVYHNCRPAELRNERQIALSFRRAVQEFNLPAYVLVSKGCK